MKAMLRETKENEQGTNTDVKETGNQINSVDQKKKHATSEEWKNKNPKKWEA